MVRFTLFSLISILGHVKFFVKIFVTVIRFTFESCNFTLIKFQSPEICQKGSYSLGKVKNIGRAADCKINPSNFPDSLIVFELTRCGFRPAANTTVT